MAKLPTMVELRQQAARMGVDITHLGRRKQAIKEFLDEQFSDIASSALSAKSAGALDHESALESALNKDKKKPIREYKGAAPLTFRKSKSKSFGPSKYFGGAPKRKSELSQIDHFLKNKEKKRSNLVQTPKGMVRVRKEDGYDPNVPTPRKNGVGPRTMVCGHQEWWWDKKLGRCTNCLPVHRYGKK